MSAAEHVFWYLFTLVAGGWGAITAHTFVLSRGSDAGRDPEHQS